MRTFLLAVMLFVIAPSDPKIAKEARTGYDSITGNDIHAHLSFLASDELEGRETSYRGQKVAARYIAAHFQKLGLKPAGTNGSYFQPFDLEVTKISEKTSISSGSKTYQFKKDFITTAARDTMVKGQVIFVGYADGKQSEAILKSAEGKIALAFAPMPDPAQANQRRRSPYTPVAGAAATLIVADENAGGTIEQLAARFGGFLDKGSMRLAGGDGAGRPSRPPGPLALAVSSELANDLLKSTGQTVEKLSEQTKAGIKEAMQTNASVTINLQLDRSTVQSENVAGLLEGSDPKLKDEYVIFTAHYDHVGIGSDGQVYNGADDDGSGTSTILELAEAFVMNPVKTKRSLVFMTVAGEEKGLLGSSYYVSNPVFPLDKTVTNLNIDMIGRVDEKHEKMKQTDYTYVIGSDKISTELDKMLVEANKESENLALDYEFNDDNDPNQFYRRSDHFNFAKNGIPIVFFFTGVHEDYHRPGDDVEKILFDRTAKIGRLVYTLGWKVGNMQEQFKKDAKPSVYQ